VPAWPALLSGSGKPVSSLILAVEQEIEEPLPFLVASRGWALARSNRGSPRWKGQPTTT